VKAISDSAELLALERAVQRVANRLDVKTIDDPLTVDAQHRLVAELNLVPVRLMDWNLVDEGDELESSRRRGRRGRPRRRPS
jgi:hypothetical protein